MTAWLDTWYCTDTQIDDDDVIFSTSIRCHFRETHVDSLKVATGKHFFRTQSVQDGIWRLKFPDLHYTGVLFQHTCDVCWQAQSRHEACGLRSRGLHALSFTCNRHISRRWVWDWWQGLCYLQSFNLQSIAWHERYKQHCQDLMLWRATNSKVSEGAGTPSLSHCIMIAGEGAKGAVLLSHLRNSAEDIAAWHLTWQGCKILQVRTHPSPAGCCFGPAQRLCLGVMMRRSGLLGHLYALQLCRYTIAYNWQDRNWKVPVDIYQEGKYAFAALQSFTANAMDGT